MKLYLTAYNIVQWLCWVYLLLNLILQGPSTSYQSLHLPLKFMQFSMLIEIFHSLLKISNSPILPTFLQTAGRAVLILGGMDLVPELFWNYMVMLMWSISEVIRYGYFNWISLVGPNKLLFWARYSCFIPLYPVGFFSEIMVYYHAYPKFSACCPRINSFAMPNEFNFAFDFYYFFCLVVVPLYGFGMPFLILHMFKQRSRKLKEE